MNYKKRYDECYMDYDQDKYDYNNSWSRHDKNHDCCMRKREDTIYCCPSYYPEEKYNNNAGQFQKEIDCYEGYFKICPKYRQKEEDKKNYNCHDNNDNAHNKRCCFCRSFFRW